MQRSVSTLIIKPTKGCNADCSYCSAPPDGAPKWSLDEFHAAFAQMEPRLHPTVTFIWHGGEPMLMGPEFYKDALAIVREKMPRARFSMQSNLLGYNSRWNAVFRDVFAGSISTSWDPDGQNRTMKGDAALYERIYQDRIGKVLADGWRPKVISTFDEASAPLMHHAYDMALRSDREGRTHDIRLNYRYPAGRAFGEGESLAPSTYGDTLIDIYDRWIVDLPDFLVTPLDQMFLRVLGAEVSRCPWSKACAGRILGIEPNFDVYNCGEFADLADERYRFGNLMTDGIDACLSSPAIRALSRRPITLPDSCKSCMHFGECEGGCMRDSVLYGRGLDGKFQYCESWQEVFSRIKESILTGEADGAIIKYGYKPGSVKARVALSLTLGALERKTNMRRMVLGTGHLPSFPSVEYQPDLSQ